MGETEWGALRGNITELDWGDRAKNWLESSSRGGVLMFSANVLWLITRALMWVIKKILSGVVGSFLTASATLLDQLAWLLHQGVQASNELAGYIKTIMERVLWFLGHAGETVASETVFFIRWVLSMLFNFLQGVAARSLKFVTGG